VLALVIGGVANMASMTIGQAVVQLRAPVDQRGRVIGVYSMLTTGLRTGNGITLAVLGSLIGVTGTVLVGGGVLAVGAVVIAALIALATARRRAAG